MFFIKTCLSVAADCSELAKSLARETRKDAWLDHSLETVLRQLSAMIPGI